MLSSQREEQNGQKTQDLPGQSSPARFDNILGSIRHLAQDIDLEEIAAAHSNVNQLVEKLLSLEKEVLTLTEIKRRLNGIGVAGKGENEKSISDSPKLNSQSTRLPKLIPFPSTTKPVAPGEALERIPPQSKIPVIVEAKQTGAAETNPASEQPKNAVKQTLLSEQKNHSQPRSHDLPAEEKKRPVASPPADTMIPFPTKAKEVPQTRLMARDFPMWEKDPMTPGGQEVAVLESTLPAEVHSRAARPDPIAIDQRMSQRIPSTRGKEKGKYQVTYSFGDKRANFDQRLRELVKTYGEVDIYSDNDTYNRKRNLKKTAFVAFVLVLAFSVFPGGASFVKNLQPGRTIPLSSSPASEPFIPKVSSSLVAAGLPTAAVPIGDMDDPSPESKPAPTKQRKLPPRKIEQQVETYGNLPLVQAPKNEEPKKPELSNIPSAISGQPVITSGQQ